MAFENVNTVALRNSLNNCKSSINYKNSEEIINKITNNDVWSTASRDNLKRALDKLINTRYKNLEKKLEQYLKIVDKIEEYQKLANTNSDGSALMQSLTNELSSAEEELSSYSDSNSNSETIKKCNNDIDDLKSKIENIKSSTKSNEQKMVNLKSSIENLL